MKLGGEPASSSVSNLPPIRLNRSEHRRPEREKVLTEQEYNLCLVASHKNKVSWTSATFAGPDVSIWYVSCIREHMRLMSRKNMTSSKPTAGLLVNPLVDFNRQIIIAS